MITINEISDKYPRRTVSIPQPMPPAPPEPTQRVWGFHINAAESDPDAAVTYLGLAKGKQPARMGASEFNYGDWEDIWFMPKPCILNNDGTVKWYINPDNYQKQADSDSDSWHRNMSAAINTMMEWPLIWYKFEATDELGSGNFYVSDEQIDESYHCWCNMDCDGNIIPHFYTAVYRSSPYYFNKSGTNTYRLRSMSGYPLITPGSISDSAGLNSDTEYTYAINNNLTDKQEWFCSLWCDRVLISALCILISKTLDSQSAFGNGFLIPTDSSAQPGRQAGAAIASGSLDSSGLFYGNTTDGSEHVKVFGMEDFWGFSPIRVWGAYVFGETATVSGSLGAKLTYGTQDGSSSSGWLNYTNYPKTFPIPPESSGVEHTIEGYVNNLTVTEKGIFPAHVGNIYDQSGGDDIFECDGFYMSSSHMGGLLLTGSAYKDLSTGPEQDIKKSGLFCMYESLQNFSGTYPWYITTMISCKPLLSDSE